MQTQNFQNHSTLRSLTRLHILFYSTVILVIVLAGIHFIHALMWQSGRITALLLLILSSAFAISYFLFRSFSLKAQDRAIRAEENLRHFVLTGKLLDTSLKINQITALRFASDDEFVALVKKAASEKLSNTAIKKLIMNWKGDYHRA